MKIKTLLPSLLVAGTLMFTACNKEAMTTMSDDDISESMSNDFSESSGGTSTDISASARTAAVLNSSVFCGLTGDSTFVYVGTGGRYNLTTTWTWVVTCTSGTPTSIDFTNTGNAAFNGTALSFTNTFVGDASITDLSNATEFTAAGTSVRTGTGSFEGKRRTKDFTYVTTFTYTDVKIKRSDYTISSGTGTAHCVGAVVDGEAFDRTATISFQGDGTYIVTLDNGNVYTFNLK
ncbi:MAG: hypothetical protein U0176_17620 [Bacteroidia bacterium]